MSKLIAAAAAVLIAGIAIPATAKAPAPLQTSAALDRAVAGHVAGPPVSCISLPRVRGSSTIADPDTLLYRMSSRLIYVNQPAGGCGLRGDPIIVSRTPSTRLCRGDIITTVDRTSRIPMGSCGLSDFVPYTKIKQAGVE